MTDPQQRGADLAAASQCVIEYTFLGFEPPYIRLEEETILRLAERVWNADAQAFAEIEREHARSHRRIRRLVRAFRKARTTRFADETFGLARTTLDVRKDSVSIHCEIRLAGETGWQPCTITIDTTGFGIDAATDCLTMGYCPVCGPDGLARS